MNELVYNVRSAVAASSLSKVAAGSFGVFPEDWMVVTGYCLDAPQCLPAGSTRQIAPKNAPTFAAPAVCNRD